MTTSQNNGGTQVVEYAHGGSEPIAVINGPGFDAVGCSVDPTTGNLAVSTYDAGSRSRYGFVVIFPKTPRYPPKAYKSIRNVHFLYCTYDSHGNLFVDGVLGRRQFVFFELSRGASTLTPLTLDQSINYPGAVQWDGSYVALADAGTQNIYQFSIANGKGTKAGATTLLDTANVTQQFWIQGNTVVYIPLVHSQSYGFGYWNYPQGGNPIQTFASGDFKAFTVSR